MRKTIITSLVICIIFITSCKKSTTSNNSSQVTICGQIWSTTNLNESRYRNGDVIPEVTDPTAWANLTTGAWCYYKNDPANEAIYGKLYNWYAVNDSRGLAPQGWHVSSQAEWTAMVDCLGTACCAGKVLKSTSGWSSGGNGTNTSGFSGLSGGLRSFNGSFTETGMKGCWWTSSEAGTLMASFDYLQYNCDCSQWLNQPKKYGFSVRLVKD